MQKWSLTSMTLGIAPTMLATLMTKDQEGCNATVAVIFGLALGCSITGVASGVFLYLLDGSGDRIFIPMMVVGFYIPLLAIVIKNCSFPVFETVFTLPFGIGPAIGGLYLLQKRHSLAKYFRTEV